MDELMQYLSSNKEWILSGIGVSILKWLGGGVVALFFWLWGVRIYKGRQTAVSQKIRSGSDSVNIQAGRDIRIEGKVKQSDPEES